MNPYYEKDIQIVIFSSQKDHHVQNILTAIPDTLSGSDIHYYTRMTDFFQAVDQLLVGYSILLIVARDTRELNQVFQLQHHLKDHTLVLVLNNGKTDLTSRGLKLFPRYISYLNGEYSDLFHVLEKMIANIQLRIKGEANGPGHPYHRSGCASRSH